jgi:hypothetical protein
LRLLYQDIHRQVYKVLREKVKLASLPLEARHPDFHKPGKLLRGDHPAEESSPNAQHTNSRLNGEAVPTHLFLKRALNHAGRVAWLFKHSPPDMDNADSIPKEVWEALDQATRTPVYFLLALGVVGILGSLVSVCWSHEDMDRCKASTARKAMIADGMSNSYTFSYTSSHRFHDRLDDPKSNTSP